MSGTGEYSESGSGELPTNSTEHSCSVFGKEGELATVTLVCVFLSLVACLVVIALVCGLKKSHFLSQRLILYLAVAATFKSLSWIHVVVQYDHSNEHPPFSGNAAIFCSVAGYFLMLTAWCEAMAVTCLSTNFFFNIVLMRRHNWLELAYILVIIFLPLALTWVPFTINAYGSTGYYCWIRLHTDKCEPSGEGIAVMVILWYIPLLLCLVYLLILYCRVLWLTSEISKRWDSNSNPGTQRQSKVKIQKDAHKLIWYPLVYFILFTVPLAAQISLVLHPKPVFSLWFLSAITQPLQGGLVAVAFTLDSQTIRRLRRQNLTATVRGLGQSVIIEDYPSQLAQEDQQYEESSLEQEYGGGTRPWRVRYTEYSMAI